MILPAILSESMTKSYDHSSIDNLIAELEEREKNIMFSRLFQICELLFGACRINGSHHIFKTPWQGDPRINLQKVGKMAKPYQVRQVISCLRKLKAEVMGHQEDQEVGKPRS